MLNEAKRLHALGFSIIWLRPKSKQPIEKGWTKAPRASWEATEKAYKKGQNMGVRLGAASALVGGGFLAVVDCDVKSESPAHLEEMREALGRLVPFEEAHPVVMSGRGNGSCHIYAKTLEPVSPFRFAQSAHKVRVKMPSVAASAHEHKVLTQEEIDDGWRLRAAWEISVMGTGQQVVLPPSFHPDTGRGYRWERRVESASDIPELEVKVTNKEVGRFVREIASRSFKPVEVELLGRLPEHTIDLILSGEGCEDRSAGLMSACLSMCRAGFSDQEILSVLTDEDTFLGAAAYEHTKSRDRAVAAKWVAEYTLKKARESVSAAADFDLEALVEEPPLSDEEREAQSEAIEEATPWQMKLERGAPQKGEVKGKLKNTSRNVQLILTHAIAPNLFGFDDFNQALYYMVDAPWMNGKRGAQVSDEDAIRVKFWLAEHYRFEPATDKIWDAIIGIADRNRFHPVRSYLNSLEWDGVERLGTWLKDYVGAEAPEPYLTAVSRKTLCAMVARVFEPGRKFDQVLILEGMQGTGKSTTVRILGGEWYTDAPLVVGDKDAVLNMRGKWVVELGELSAMRKAEVDAIKAFITQEKDRIRNPYGRVAADYPRQCIFIGTTNSDEYLRDTTGNRRFWPVKVGACNFDGLERVRDQLFAEAVWWYGLGEALYLSDTEERAQAVTEQEKREVYDDVIDVLRDYFEHPSENFTPERFRINDLIEWGPVILGKLGTDVGAQRRLATALTKLGFRKLHTRQGNFWSKPEAESTKGKGEKAQKAAV